MKKNQMELGFFVLCLATGVANAGEIASKSSVLGYGLHANIHVGTFRSTLGGDQQIEINLLPSAGYTATKTGNWNALFGVGLLKNYTGFEQSFSYGVAAFYLPETSVAGQIYQANLFNNLAYSYNMTSVPIYAIAKKYFHFMKTEQQFVIDAGIGPNILSLSNYNESLNNPMTVPDNAYKSHVNTTFSATAGVSLRLNSLFRNAPIECGYRFFYLGSGMLGIKNDQYLTQLSTGPNYANAATCTVVI